MTAGPPERWSDGVTGSDTLKEVRDGVRFTLSRGNLGISGKTSSPELHPFLEGSKDGSVGSNYVNQLLILFSRS